MERAVSDASFYLKLNDDILYGITGSYVEENINARDELFQEFSKLTVQTFDCKPRKYDTFCLFGTQINTARPGRFYLSQHNYIETLQELQTDANITKF